MFERHGLVLTRQRLAFRFTYLVTPFTPGISPEILAPYPSVAEHHGVKSNKQEIQCSWTLNNGKE